MAVDQNVIVKTVLGGFGVASGALPPLHPWYLKPADYPTEVRKYLEYRPEEAKRLLAEAGYGKGLRITISTTPRWGMLYTATLEAIMDMAKPAGFDVNIKLVEYNQFLASTAVAGKFPDDEDATLLKTTRGNPWADAYLFHSQNAPSENKGHVKDPEYDALAEAFLNATQEARQRDLIRQLQVRIVDQVYWIYVGHEFVLGAYQPWVRDYAYSGEYKWNSRALGRVWLDR